MTAHSTTPPQRVMAPRLPTPTPLRADSKAAGRVPDEFYSEQVARISLLSGIGVGLWGVGLMMDAVLVPALPGSLDRIAGRVHFIEIVGILVSAAMWTYVRFSSHAPRTKSDVNLAFMVLNAAGIAALNNWAGAPPTSADMMRLSWITIVILVFAMVTPASPRKVLIASMIAASLDPLGVWVAYVNGVPVPSVWQTFTFFLPNYSCAVVATLACRMTERLRTQLNRAREMGSYRLVRPLGHGGMGEVWEARHHLLARRAAIKLIRPEVLGTGTSAEARILMRRFEREAQATASLCSPHTISIFDFGVTGDNANFYYVMELLSGMDLESLIRQFGPMPADRAVFLLRQVCHSLADAHARGLVHRDIKPANVYVCRMGLEYDFVKVLDFGLVKFGQGPMNHTLVSADQMTTGTPAYMAPEVILGERDVDRRADVYAVGCLAYFVLTGRLVFEGDTAMKVLLQHVQADPIPPSQRTEIPIPHEVDAVVMACLQKDPAKRPQDAGALFRLACGCQAGNAWGPERAQSWWEHHLPEYTRPLTLPDEPPRAGENDVAKTAGARP